MTNMQYYDRELQLCKVIKLEVEYINHHLYASTDIDRISIYLSERIPEQISEIYELLLHKKPAKTRGQIEVERRCRRRERLKENAAGLDAIEKTNDDV